MPEATFYPFRPLFHSGVTDEYFEDSISWHNYKHATFEEHGIATEFLFK